MKSGCGLMMHWPIGAHSQTAGDGRRFPVTARTGQVADWTTRGLADAAKQDN